MYSPLSGSMSGMLSFYLPLLLLPSLASAFSFNFTSTPRQCQTLNISISGSGQPPYSVLIIPFGASPLPNNTEVRKIFQQNFTGNATSQSFQLNYPANSQFVAVVGDQNGFSSGGTSGAVTVLSSDDSSCFNPTQGVEPGFFYSLVPSSLTQCQPTRIWWDPTAGVQGTPVFRGIIPGGQSFDIPQGNLTQVPEEGTGLSWTTDVRAGTTVMVLGGDNRGPGTGGSSTYIVNYGTDSSCLNDASPSSTAGPPAGGSYPTSTSDSDTGSTSPANNHNSHTGAIVGKWCLTYPNVHLFDPFLLIAQGALWGGVGGFLVVCLAAWFLWRRQRTQKTQKERPVDLLQDQEGDGDHDTSLPQYYQPEPFVLPEPTVASSSVTGDPETAMASGMRPSIDHRLSQYSTTTGEGAGLPTRPVTPSQASTYMRKSPAPPSFRPVNIIQHDDAGPSEYMSQLEPETIELPPAYTNIRRDLTPHEPPPAPQADD
ncbi:hypothetical protein NM688_g2686 [Phlebia brevispora]|uniref:Uncharacterized protein n=1 Tax=Phlebia brevispora TaxID=194682 RepID=A0ACC1T7S7_9APHY|nr:hypothetical protein NM688_g2686 [Phlebia brevispora]